MVDAGVTPSLVRVVAVTKGFGPEAVVAARRAGLDDVGENYAQELLAKYRALAGGGDSDRRGGGEVRGGGGGVRGGDEGARPEGEGDGGSGLRWHFLGAVQRNKVPQLAPVVSCWQSVSRLAEGEAIARRRPGAEVLVEVEVTGAPGRNGCAPDHVAELVGGLRTLDLDVRGLMTVAPQDADGAQVAFRRVRRLADDLGLPERSMGMSDDYLLAVREGSTMVRLGRALFGLRPPRQVNKP
jgi:PLP dependent protein